MKKLLFLAGGLFLLTIHSCANNEDPMDQNPNVATTENGSALSSKTLARYVSDQLDLETKIKDMMDAEKEADFSLIQSRVENIRTIEELERLYKSARIKRVKEIISLYEKMVVNSENFRSVNTDFYSQHKEEERKAILAQEIDRQLDYREEVERAAGADCQGDYVRATNRCMRDYGIAMAGAAIVGAFSGGTGAVIGGAVATAHMIACNSDADSDYHRCMKQ